MREWLIFRWEWEKIYTKYWDWKKTKNTGLGTRVEKTRLWRQEWEQEFSFAYFNLFKKNNEYLSYNCWTKLSWIYY